MNNYLIRSYSHFYSLAQRHLQPQDLLPSGIAVIQANKDCTRLKPCSNPSLVSIKKPQILQDLLHFFFWINCDLLMEILKVIPGIN